MAIVRHAMATALVLALALAACGGDAKTTASAAGPRSVAILVYHHLGDPPPGERNPSLYVTPERFRATVAALDRSGFQAVTLGRVWAAWHGTGRLPRRPVVLSFDDGYAEQDTVARPALAARGWPGTMNLELGRLDAPGGLSTAAIGRMRRAGWEIDDHTVTHPDLTRVSAQRLAAEVGGSRAQFRRRLGVDPRFFCFPYGRANAAVRAAVRTAGFLAATTIEPRLATPRDNPYALPRIVVRRAATPAEVAHLAGG
ncbi:MAG TPA: polysaccharide deacetylase family protein [Baekduia sp.]